MEFVPRCSFVVTPLQLQVGDGACIDEREKERERETERERDRERKREMEGGGQKRERDRQRGRDLWANKRRIVCQKRRATIGMSTETSCVKKEVLRGIPCHCNLGVVGGAAS